MSDPLLGSAARPIWHDGAAFDKLDKVLAVAHDPAVAAERVLAHCATRLARFKQPARIEIVAELPLTVTGKVQKGRLRGIERRRALGLLE